MAVLLTHVAFWAGAYTTHGTIGLLLARLDVGVAIFFVLSGFLLSYHWLARGADGSPAPAIGAYFRKRVLRIWPLYLVTATLALSLIHANRGLSAGDWLLTFALANIYVHPTLPDGLTHMWSLATEVAFYAVLPLLMLVGVGRRLRAARTIALLVVMWVIALGWLGGWSSRVPRSYGVPVNEWLPAYLGWFGAGIGLALCHVLLTRGRLHPVVTRGLRAIGARPGACWVAIAGLMLVASTPVAGPIVLVTPTPAAAVAKNLLYAVIGLLVVLPGVFGVAGSTYQRALSAPWLRHLGHISYGIFCIHLPVLSLVTWLGVPVFQGHFWLILGTTLLITLPAAELLYRFVERPMMRLWRPGRKATAPAKTAPKAASTR